MWDMAYIRGLRGGGRKKTHAKRRVCGQDSTTPDQCYVSGDCLILIWPGNKPTAEQSHLLAVSQKY